MRIVVKLSRARRAKSSLFLDSSYKVSRSKSWSMRKPNVDAKVTVQMENIRAEFRLEKTRSRTRGNENQYEVSQNRCKVLRDTPPGQVAKVNPNDWSLHRLWLWGRGKGKVSRKDSQYHPNLAPAVVTAVLSRVLAVQRSPANLCRDYFVFSRV